MFNDIAVNEIAEYTEGIANIALLSSRYEKEYVCKSLGIAEPSSYVDHAIGSMDADNYDRKVVLKIFRGKLTDAVPYAFAYISGRYCDYDMPYKVFESPLFTNRPGFFVYDVSSFSQFAGRVLYRQPRIQL